MKNNAWNLMKDPRKSCTQTGKMSYAFHSAGVNGKRRLNNEIVELQDHRRAQIVNKVQISIALKHTSILLINKC